MANTLEFLVELTLGGVFQNEVNSCSVIEVSVEAQNIGMPEVRLNLNLTPKLVLNIALLKLIFEEDLQ